MTRLIEALRMIFCRQRPTANTEPYGPVIPWQERLERAKARVPNPKGEGR